MAQTTYNLVGDIDIDDCEGFFEDSNGATDGINYLHGEDYTFTICVPNAISIEMNFFEFCSEAGFDVMTFYDGPDVNSPIIGAPHSGLDLPPTIIATSGCLTVHWESDQFGVACSGWLAYWEVEVEEPEPPVVTFDPSAPTCSTEVIIMEFDQPIPCDSVYIDAFTLSGGQSISSITPLNCSGGEGTQFELTLAPGLDESAVYDLAFVYNYADDCGNEFSLEVEGSFEVNDCPLQVEVLEESTTVCLNECVEVWVEVTGGDPNTYNYAWNNGLPNSAGPHLVCPTVTTTYSVTVSDAGPSASASDQTTITVAQPPVIDPIPDVCKNEAPFSITASPSGGSWSGTHINDPLGVFRPDSGNGTPWTYYTDLNGCTDSIQSEVYQVWAGYNQSSCPGAAPFQLNNGSPVGGIWSGPFTTPAGIFNPSTSGTYSIIYTTADGCTDTKIVRVDDIAMPSDMTVCQSDPQFNLSAIPFGGVWSGTGVANWYWGTYKPADAGPGTHTITYTLNGCSATMEITVTQIDAGGNYVICPEESPIQLNGVPSGGTWSGIGVSSSGLYDPTIAPSPTNDTLTYSLNGCTDTRVVYVQQTTILWDYHEFCLYDDALTLNWGGVHRYPGGGNWSGSGTDNNGPGHFTPGTAGAGTHTLYYTANTCTDSMTMVVHENTMFDSTVCEQGDPIDLMALPAGGTWAGDGIINATNGTFDPSVVGLGQHWVYYQGPSGCWDSCMVDVYELEPASISGLANTYCHTDSAIVLSGYPDGGFFSGSGLVNDSTFNPIVAGEGFHEISYDHGSAGCEVHDDILVAVSPPISTITDGDGETVCEGDPITIGVEANGGNGDQFIYDWNPNVTWFPSVELYPDTTTTYEIITSDGCSDPVIDSITVIVHQPFSAVFTTTDTMCYGANGNATVEGVPSAFYGYEWHTQPPSFSNTVYGPVAYSYPVTITHMESGCEFDTSVTIPSWPNVTAFFTPNPNGSCLLESDPTAEFIDLSQGAASGTWDFGDGTVEDYVYGQYPTHTYPDTGRYMVTLYVENEQGTCTDEQEFEMCVLPEFTLWIPNSFTPDGDGLNDVFEIVSSGIVEFELLISSSWGHKIYRMTSIDDPFWDGTYKGKPVQQDRYIYEVIAKGRHLGGVKFHKGSGYIHVIRH